MSTNLLDDELRYKLLKAFEENPRLSQREVSGLIGVSLGKVNYCVNALVEAGLLKVSNFINSSNKKQYLYLLTSNGISEKTQVTHRFLKYKESQFENLSREIESLRKEVNKQKKDGQ